MQNEQHYLSLEKSHLIGRIEDHYLLDQPQNEIQLRFFKTATGIEDSEELKLHIISIAQQALEIVPYPCIWACYFCLPRVINHPIYQQVLLQSHQDSSNHLRPIFLDVGSFMGVDLRQVAHSGMKEDNLMGTDLIEDWDKMGDKLFFDKEKLITFIKGDIFDNQFLNPQADELKSENLPINLHSIQSLNQLRGHLRFISCISVFHLFDFDLQTELAQRLLSLLKKKVSGSTIFGSHIGSDQKGLIKSMGQNGMLAHSPESWRSMWENLLPDPQAYQIGVSLSEPTQITWMVGIESLRRLNWSITIL